MALQNITPQYQAEEKTAQLHLRPVPIHNGLYETGKMLTDAGQGLQKGAFSLTLGLKQRNDRLQAEEDELNLADKLNYVTSEATKYVAEYKKLGGMATEGGTQKYDAFMDGLLAKGQEGLSPKAARAFGQRFASLRLSLWNTVNGHEYSNVKSARIQGIQGQIENLAATFKLTRDPAILGQIRESYNQLWEAQTGVKLPQSLTEDWGRRYNPETDQMDGAKKGNGWLGVFEDSKGRAVTEKSMGFVYDGKRVEVPALNPYTADYVEDILNDRITPEIKERIRKWGEDRVAEGKSPFYDGDTEDDELRSLSPSQKAAEENMRLYQQGWQNISDKVLGGLFDEYSAEGDLNGMSAIYFNSEKFFGVELSDKAKVRMKQVVDQKTTEQVNEQLAQDYMLDINAAGGDYAEGGRYNTAEQDEKFKEIIDMLEATGNKDDKIVADRLKRLRDAQILVQKENLGNGIKQNLSDLFQGETLGEWENDLWTLRSRIDAMPSNPLKDALEDYYRYNEKELAKRYEAVHKNEQAQIDAATKAEATRLENERKAQEAKVKAHAASRAHRMNVARIKDEICAKGARPDAALSVGTGREAAVFYFRRNGSVDAAALRSYLNANAYELGGDLLPEEREEILYLATSPVAVKERESAISRVTLVLSDLINKNVPQKDKITLDPNTIALAVPDLIDYTIDIQREWTGGGEVDIKSLNAPLNQAIINYFSIFNNDDEAMWAYLKDGINPETGRINWQRYNETGFRDRGIPAESELIYANLLNEQTTKPISTRTAMDKENENALTGGE